MKTCGNCKEEKDINEFRTIKEKRTKNVSEYLCSICKLCERNRALEKYHNNKEKYQEYSKQYKIDNKDKINETRRKYTKEKMKVIEERLKRNMKTLLCIKLKKTQNSSVYFGETIKNIKKWIEFNFNIFMNWENYGSYWEIDHSLPVNCFNMLDNNDTNICFCWMNLMPLEKNINSKKSNKIINTRIFYQEIRLKKYSYEFPELREKIDNYIKLYSNKYKSQI
jgi:hypothetical protein